MIEETIRDILTAHAALYALVGERIYPMDLPQEGTYPAVTYQIIDAEAAYSHDGDSNLDRKLYQFSCWDMTCTGAKSVAEQLRDALSGYRGGDIGSCLLSGINEDKDPETGLYHVDLDFAFLHKI